MMADNDREIFEKLNRQGETLARIDERTARMDQDWQQRSADHEKRLQTLELKDAKRGGFITGIASLASLLSSALTWLASQFIHLPNGGN